MRGGLCAEAKTSTQKRGLMAVKVKEEERREANTEQQRCVASAEIGGAQQSDCNFIKATLFLYSVETPVFASHPLFTTPLRPISRRVSSGARLLLPDPLYPTFRQTSSVFLCPACVARSWDFRLALWFQLHGRVRTEASPHAMFPRSPARMRLQGAPRSSRRRRGT